MLELKSKVLELMAKRPHKKWGVKELASLLHVKGAQHKELKKILKSITKEKVRQTKPSKQGAVADRRSDISAPKSKEITGRFSMHYDGYGFVAQDEPGQSDIFVAARNKGSALPDDRVAVEVRQSWRGDRTEGFITKIIERGREEWIGTLSKVGREYYVRNREYKDEYHIHIAKEKILEAHIGDVVMCRILFFPEGTNGFMEGEVTHVLGPEGEESTEIRTVLAKHNIPEKFPANVIKEAKDLKPYKANDLETRVDLRDKPFITIDGADARDFDDAICVESTKSGFRLYVSIADVSHYIRPGSALDEEALVRGNSTYFPRFAVPMLPEELSNNLCSLKEGEDRPTMTCELIYNSQGHCEKALYYRSVIHSLKRGTYEEIQRLLDGEKVKGYGSVPDLAPAKKLATLLMKIKKERGALDFDLPEPYFEFDENQKIIGVKKRSRLFTHQLIEEFMLAANEALAQLFEFKEIPSLYRVHEQPDPKKMEVLSAMIHNLGVSVSLSDKPAPKELAKVLAAVKGHASEEAINQALLRSLRVAVYSEINKGHYGLSLKHYCHFTSPIRRYPDLIVHRCLAHLLSEQGMKPLELALNNFFERGKKVKAKAKQSKLPYSTASLIRLGEQTSKTERQSMEAEREMQSLLKTLFIKDHLGETFKGVVRRVVKFGLFIELSPHCIEGLLRTEELGLDRPLFDETHARITGKNQNGPQAFKLGSQLSVQVVKADIPRRQIELSLEKVAEEKPKRKFGTKKRR